MFRIMRCLMFITFVLFLLGCQREASTVTAVIPTSTQIPATPTSTNTPLPTDTPIPATPIPATNTPTATQPPPSPTPTPSVWDTLATMPTKRSEMPALLWNGRIYVPGGFGNSNSRATQSTFEAYEIATDTWHTLAELPMPMNHHMMALINEQMFIFPSERAPVLRYDVEADAWHELGDMPDGRWGGTAVTLGDFIYIIGGASSDQSLLRYDPTTDTWESLAPLLQAREHTQAVVLNDEIYVLGGRWNSGFNSVEVYNPDTDTWRRSPSMNQPRSGFGATVWDGKIVVIGGELLSPLNIINTVEFYDPETRQWALAEYTLPAPLHGMPIVTDGDAIYVIGGSGIAGGLGNRGMVYRLRP